MDIQKDCTDLPVVRRLEVVGGPTGRRRWRSDVKARIVAESFEDGLDPFCGAIYAFRAKRGDRIKVLLWDGSGLVLGYKRLEEGKFAWPSIREGIMRLTRGQFEALIEGLDWRRVYGPRVRRPLAAD